MRMVIVGFRAMVSGFPSMQLKGSPGFLGAGNSGSRCFRRGERIPK
jgi:hypothetical protein